jgi:hypothetical protein
VFEIGVSGIVRGFATGCCAADNGTTAPILVELPGARATLVADGVPICPDDSGTILEELFSSEANGSQGEFAFADVTLPARASSELIAESIRVLNCEGIASGFPFNCLLAEDLGQLEGLRACEDIAGPEVEIRFNALPPRMPYPANSLDTAQVNAFHGVQKARLWFKNVQPTFSGINDDLACLVNMGGGSP